MLTKEQIETLSAWEENFETAIRAKWALNPGTTALTTMVNIWNEATGNERKLNPSCGNCIFRLLEEMGQMYFDSKKALEAEAAMRAKLAEAAGKKTKKVELSEEPANPSKKVAVSTQREKKKRERK